MKYRIMATLGYLSIIAMAAGLRLYFADLAYPADLDSVHLIQGGVQWARGVPGQLSGINQELPVLVSGTAYKAGLDPARTLQAFTVALGVAVVGCGMLIGWRFYRSHAVAVLTGIWMAANPGLIVYSVNSMPEIGFAACLLIAFVLAADVLCRRALRLLPVMGAFAVLSVGMYFKPLDSLTLAFVLAAGITLAHARTPRVLGLVLAGGIAAYVAVAVPHYYMQSSAMGEDTMGVGLVNRGGHLVKGFQAYDSTYEYGAAYDAVHGDAVKELQAKGIAGWLWQHRGEVMNRYKSNAAGVMRQYNHYLFTQSFRLGTGWFILVIIVVIAVGLRGEYRWPTIFLWTAAFAFPAGVSLSYVFDRWLVIYVPLLMILFVAALVKGTGLAERRWIPWAGGGILLLMGMTSVRGLDSQLRDEQWFWSNHRDVASWLSGAASKQDRVMSGRPTLMLEMDIEHPDRWVQLPPFALERVEQIAGERKVSFIVLADSFYAHWPANRLLTDADLAPPVNWKMVYDRTFERAHPVWGTQKERYRIYDRRTPGGTG